MVSPSSVVAHVVKLVVTVACARHLGEPYGNERRAWSLRAFQMLLAHSILGVLRFGYTVHIMILNLGTPFVTSATTTAKGFRNFYDWFSGVVEIVPLALLTTDILHGYDTDEKVRIILLSLGVLPLLFQLVRRPKERQLRKYQLLINITATLQLLAITLVGLRHGNYNVISLVASYAFVRFFIEEFCYHFDVPYTDLTQYCFSFVEIFAILALKDV